MSAGLIIIRITRARDHCGRDDHPNAWNGHQTATGFILTCQSHEICINRCQFRCYLLELSNQIVQGASGRGRQARIIFVTDNINKQANSMRPSRGDNSKLSQMPSGARASMARTRRQSNPANSASNCAWFNIISPSFTAGHVNVCSSNRL